MTPLDKLMKACESVAIFRVRLEGKTRYEARVTFWGGERIDCRDAPTVTDALNVALIAVERVLKAEKEKADAAYRDFSGV